MPTAVLKKSRKNMLKRLERSRYPAVFVNNTYKEGALATSIAFWRTRNVFPPQIFAIWASE